MTLPFVRHGVFTVVAGKLAGAFESRVRVMARILASFS